MRKSIGSAKIGGALQGKEAQRCEGGIIAQSS